MQGGLIRGAFDTPEAVVAVMPPSDIPQTGDPSMLGSWAALLFASAAGLKLKKKK